MAEEMRMQRSSVVSGVAIGPEDQTHDANSDLGIHVTMTAVLRKARGDDIDMTSKENERIALELGSQQTGLMLKGRQTYMEMKRFFDISVSLALLPLMLAIAAALAGLNPFFNKGSLFFVQKRMGKNCLAFHVVKFRTMIDVETVSRKAHEPLERDRITSLGLFLRKSRIDELPQVLNVLRGQMSLIGPRPDFYDHALVYIDIVPGYRERHEVRPGISGLAQTELGYVEGLTATEQKVRMDLHYIRHMGLMLDAWIIWRTVTVVFGMRGR